MNKFMEIIELFKRIVNIIKILKIEIQIMKIMKILEFLNQNKKETHFNFRIQIDNYENHENL